MKTMTEVSIEEASDRFYSSIALREAIALARRLAHSREMAKREQERRNIALETLYDRIEGKCAKSRILTWLGL